MENGLGILNTWMYARLKTFQIIVQIFSLFDFIIIIKLKFSILCSHVGIYQLKQCKYIFFNCFCYIDDYKLNEVGIRD